MRIVLVLLVCLFLSMFANGLVSTVAAADDGDPASVETDPELPVDPAVRIGQLDNGLRYIIRENGRPEARADLRLVIEAGSVDEDDDQQGFAHFIEHMLFNGTESYAGNEIIDYFESIGSRFGADLNAYTSFDETVYMFHIPTDKEGLLDEGIRIFGEFATKATLTSEEIEKERGVVLDEWRRRLGAGKRVFDEQLPVLMKGSRYAERLPIGLPEIIEHGDADALRRYYREWYRPERMSVLAVGDFDADDVERQIREVFGAIPATEDLREAQDWDVPVHADTLFALADDSELRGTSVRLSRKRPAEDAAATEGEYRSDLVETLARGMFGARLAELARSADPPFLRAGMGSQTWGDGTKVVELWARVPDGEEAKGLEAVLLEEKRVFTHGFMETELDRVRKRMLAGIEATWAEREKTDSGAYVSEYTRHVLRDEPIPGIDFEVQFYRDQLPNITTEECLAAFREAVGTGGAVLLASRPSRDDLPDEADLMDVLHRVAEARPEPYVDDVPSKPLLPAALIGGEVVSRSDRTEIGVTELDLSNGIHVILRPTSFQDDTVLFNLVSLGGLSMADESELVSAASATGIVSESGWGGHSITDLGRMLAGKVASASPYFYSRRHGISGSSTIEDLATALELVVLEMTAPNVDEAAFKRYLARSEARLANRDADPGVKYRDRLTAINSQDHPRSRPMTLERLNELDHGKAVDFYRNAFRNAEDFTLFVVGNLDLDVVIPEIVRTIGSLPRSDDPALSWVDHEVLFPDGITRETVHAGSEPKSSTSINLGSYDGTDPFEWHRLRTATSILGRRLRERLREDQGATYGVSVSYSWSLVGPARGLIRVGFGCDPRDAQSLGEEVFRTLQELQADGPTDEELAKEREIQTRGLETSVERNGYWLGSLFALWVTERPLEEIGIRQQRIDDLEPDSLHRVFREHFDVERYTWIDWLPEETPEEAVPGS